MYRYWADGSKIFLKYCSRKWEIEIIRNGRKCTFGEGWHEFAKASQLVDGDTLVFFKDSSADNYILNVCIFNRNHYIHDHLEGSLVYDFKFILNMSIRLAEDVNFSKNGREFKLQEVLF